MTADPTTTTDGKLGLPTWAKILIGLVVIGVVGLVIVLVGGIFLVKNIAQQSQDPASIARTAKSIADFQEPLPAGYKITMGLGILGINTITAEHKPDGQMLIVMSYPKAEGDAQALLNKVYDAGISTPQASAKFNQVRQKGTETVAGENVPYMIGTLTDKNGGKFDGMVAAMVDKAKSKTVIFYGIQPPGAQYKLDETRAFLQAIKSF